MLAMLGYFILAFKLPNPAKDFQDLCLEFTGNTGVKGFDQLAFDCFEEVVSAHDITESKIPYILDRMDREAYQKNRTKKLSTEIKQRELVVSIDLTRNIKEQISIVSKLALAKKKKLKQWDITPKESRSLRKSEDLYQKYIRVLDAFHCGSKHPEIAQHLLSDKDKGCVGWDDDKTKTINNWRIAAEKYKNTKYEKLATMK